MDEKERAKKDIGKLAAIIKEFGKLGLDMKYVEVMKWVENYSSDANHFYKEGKYYTAFGAANYAYGMIDAILIIEGKKDEAQIK